MSNNLIENKLLVFTASDIENIAEVKLTLERNSKADLTPFVRSLNSMMRFNGWRCDETVAAEYSNALHELASKSYTASSKCCHEALSLIFSGRKNMDMMLSHIPEAITGLVKYLLNEDLVMLSHLPQEFASMFIRKERFMRKEYEIDEMYKDYAGFFKFYNNESYGRRSEYVSVMINPQVQHLLILLFVDPKEYQFGAPTQEAPQSQHTFNAEGSLRNEWQQMQWLVKNGKINVMDRTSQYVLKNNYISTFAKNADTTEFYTDKKLDLSVRRIRSKMLVNIFATLIKNNVEEYVDNLIKVVREVVNIETMHKTLLLPQFSSRSLFYLYLTPFTTRVLEFILNNCRDKGWYDVKDIVSNILLNPLFNFDVRDLKKRVELTYYLSNTWNGEKVFCENSEQEVIYPVVQGLIFMLASVGIVEIAYDDVDKTMASCYSGLRAFRLTSLGRYELGMENDYKRESGVVDDGIELEDNILLIKVKNEHVPGIGFIKSISVPATTMRYRVTFKTFLKECKNAKDAMSNVAIFRSIIKGEMPQIWSDFLAEIERKCVPMKLLNSRNYFIYEVPADNKELLKIFVTDSTLLSLCHRATGNLILVKVDDLPKFKSILLDYGYSL